MAKTVEDCLRIAISDYQIPEEADSTELGSATLRVHRRQMRKRGERRFWICDGCERHVTALYLRAGCYRCRTCHGLVYRVQLESKQQRRRRRAARRAVLRQMILTKVSQLLALLER